LTPFSSAIYFGVIGLGCKFSPILRQDEKIAPKLWRHILRMSLTLIGVGVINLNLGLHDATGMHSSQMRESAYPEVDFS
jgi:hypothetical protein